MDDPREKIIVALDVNDAKEAIKLAEDLFDYVGGFKIGLEFFTSTYIQLMTITESKAIELLSGLRQLYEIVQRKLLWDGKWNDIPNTIKGTTLGMQPLSPKFINIHASSGKKAIKEAVANKGNSKVLGVTVLTSVDSDECISIFGTKPGLTVSRFANMLVDVDVDGVICSPKELEYLSQDPKFDSLEKVTPGIRPIWAKKDDQARIMTPTEAIKAGVDRMVIGRPLREPPSEIGGPVEAAKRIIEEIVSAQ